MVAWKYQCLSINFWCKIDTDCSQLIDMALEQLAFICKQMVTWVAKWGTFKNIAYFAQFVTINLASAHSNLICLKFYFTLNALIKIDGGLKVKNWNTANAKLPSKKKIIIRLPLNTHSTIISGKQHIKTTGSTDLIANYKSLLVNQLIYWHQDSGGLNPTTPD